MNPLQHSASSRTRDARSAPRYFSLSAAGKYTLHGNNHSRWNSQKYSRGTVL